MNAHKQIEIYRELDEKIMQVTTSKRNDYASDFDVLLNFKGVAEAAKALGIDITDPSQYALFMVILKIKRITNLINSKKTPNNESIEDSFLDGINYFKLAYCCFKDK